ncbi:hypothetical protein NS226_04215 [Aureimonas ureilytica]|uniref:Uncharacterized protein n=1 Tax=Aureimonas ureilytica TaxID=401562 RepID=A0A175RBY7_9HYPH|nr:hypothetical protein NS226_04215 [Aureimonas ureilytica]
MPDSTAGGMFQVGKSYEFRMIEGDDEVVFLGDVEAYEHPLLKIRDVPERPIPIRLMHGDAPGEQSVQAPQMVPR